jgi:signal transduction histidine kinase
MASTGWVPSGLFASRKNTYTKVFLHTPACYGFTIIAEVIPGREPMFYEHSGQSKKQSPYWTGCSEMTMLTFGNIQHILVTGSPALTGRYEFPPFRSPAAGRAWPAAILDKVYSAEGVRASIDNGKRWAAVAFTRNGLRLPGVIEPSPVSFPGEFHQGIVAQTQIPGDTGTNHFGYSNQSFQPVIKGSDDEPRGHGEVGRYLQSVSKEIVDTIAARSLKDMPIVRGANAYMFDSGALRSRGVGESELPPGSTVALRPSTLWQRTKSKWVVAFAIAGCLSALGSYVRLKRRRDRQLALGGMLIRAQERERSRIASEIHDDFSQRLAVMALELENAEEAIAASPGEAVRQVHNILNSASELGADLHTLSHRLHSSTLERLGLVPGVTALCKEFAVQQGIEVDLLTHDVPRSVHPDAALCLFRIVQEGLRNLKKHSGATKARVRLGRTGGKLYVSVSDEGIGFELHDLEEKAGLGIRSMEERASLMGGRFEIHSKPGKGTRIEASIPIIQRKTAQREARPVADQFTGYGSD